MKCQYMKYTNFGSSRNIPLNSHILQILIICSVICVIPAFGELFSFKISGRIHTVVALIILTVFFLRYNYLLDSQGWVYIISLSIFAILHFNLPTIDRLGKNCLIWINLIVIIYLSKNCKSNAKFLLYCVISFYIIECSLCVIEKLWHFYLIDYSNSEMMSATKGTVDDYDFINFRSRGFLLHPLYNANVISIYMGYLLVSNQFTQRVRIMLLIIGVLGIWACNSRGCELVWIVILIYRFSSLKTYFLILVVLSVILFPVVLEFGQKYGIWGRLNDFSDDSVNSRFLAYSVFFAHSWTLSEIVTGLGDWIYYPSSQTIIENGFLLNCAYWGWIIGSIKSFIEISLTYRCLTSYKFKEKMIIMLSFWGVASLNSNIINILFLSFFSIINIAFNASARKRCVSP